MLLDVDGTRTSFQMFDLLELFDENSFQVFFNTIKMIDIIS